MKDTDFAYAVARIRAREPELLRAADMEQILSAPDPAAAESLLAGKGYAVELGLDAALHAKAAQAWQLIAELLPQPGAAPPGTGSLDFLIVKNDFHNLKAQVKAIFTAGAAEGCLVRPTVFDPAQVGELLRAKRFAGLPACMAACAQEAYELLARTMDGQLADAVIDRQCLETILAMARAGGSAFAAGLAEKLCAFANARIALRAEKTHKRGLLEQALCSVPAAEIPAEARQSSAAFEKYCDDALLEYALPAKWKCFGPEPLIAYFLAVEAEIKTVRIVMACKQHGAAAEEIRKRVRRLYVV
jgi:V/A-type H+-transporting ATPase subunit C